MEVYMIVSVRLVQEERVFLWSVLVFVGGGGGK